jgi:hypothetical protein
VQQANDQFTQLQTQAGPAVKAREQMSQINNKVQQLQALATQPAMRQYKWVGGQSVTTGLKCFSGFISDDHHTPPGSDLYYTEPLLRVPGGYVSYTPPPYMPAPQSPPSDGVHVGIIANPAKLSDGYLAYVRQNWAAWQQRSIAPLQLHLIDKRYQLAPLQQRISDQLMGLPVHFHTPASHADYLTAIGRLHCVLDTWPYSGGLTTIEAHALGVPVYTLSLGAGSAVLKALGDDARGLAVARTGPSPSRPNIQLTRDFQASMKRHDKPVDYDRYTGYMDARVLIEGLRAAGPNVTRASLVQAMEGLGTLDLGGYVYQFSAQNHHGSNYVDIAVVGAGGVYRQ